MLAKPFGYKNFFAIMNKYLPHPGGWKRPRSKRTIAKEAEGEGGTSSQAAKANEPNPLVSIEGTGVHAEREPGTKSDARVEDPPAQNSGANERPMLDTAMTDAEHSHNHSHEVSLDADCTPSTAPERVISGDHHEEEGKGSASDVDMDEGGDSDYNSSDFYEDEYEEEMGNNNDDSENEDEEGEDEDEVSSQEADIKEEDESPKMFLANPQTINMHPPWTIDTVNYDGGNPPMAVDLAMTLNGTPKGSSPNLRNRYGTASPSFIGSDGRISTTGIGHVSR